MMKKKAVFVQMTGGVLTMMTVYDLGEEGIK